MDCAGGFCGKYDIAGRMESVISGCSDEQFITRSLTQFRCNYGSPLKPIRTLKWGASRPPEGTLWGYRIRVILQTVKVKYSGTPVDRLHQKHGQQIRLVIDLFGVQMRAVVKHVKILAQPKNAYVDFLSYTNGGKLLLMILNGFKSSAEIILKRRMTRFNKVHLPSGSKAKRRGPR